MDGKDNNRGQTKKFLNGMVAPELRRPHHSPLGIGGNSSSSTGGTAALNSADSVTLSQNSAVPSNSNSTPMPLGIGSEFVPAASRTEITYGYAFSSEAVNVPAKPPTNVPSKSKSLLEPHLSETVVKNSKLSPLAKEFVPRTFVTEDSTSSSAEEASTLEYMMCMVDEFIDEVTLNPGKFDEEVILLTEALSVMIKTNELTRSLINIIFRQAITEPNFRYNGARLCKHLIEHLVNDPKARNFQFCLLEKCQTEFEQRDMLIKSNPAYLRGLVFFFGEIYSQIVQASGRINVVRNAIVCLLDSLLKEPNSDDLKCVCQVLKMTGANMEDDERDNSQQEKLVDWMGLDQIFERLKTINLPSDLQSMVSNVIQLRSINWGRSSIPSETQPPAHVMVTNRTIATSSRSPAPQPGGAVFYGPDGQPISNEEALFLESQSYFDYRIDTYDEDFNDEIAEDYESFLREMGQ